MKKLCLNGTAFSPISGKEDNLAGILKCSEISYRELPKPFHLSFPQIYRIFGQIVPDFPVETFPGRFRTICSRFEIFRNFGRIERVLIMNTPGKA